jgi:diguanylate cyclase (GGDEF)-like protein
VTILIVLAGVAAALILATGAWFVSRRTARADAQAEVGAVVAALTARVDALASDLQKALERAESEGRRGRFLGDLTATIDLDDLVERILQAASGFPGIDAAVVCSSGPDGSEPGRFVAGVGMSEEEAEQQSFNVLPGAVAVSYRYAAETDGFRSALALPLNETAGFLAVYSRAQRDLDAELGPDLEEIALRAGPALDNAFRYREARRLADIDALTGLHNRRYFHETLHREAIRARRYGRALSLLVLDVDDFKAINERVGHLGGDAVLAETAARVLGVLRQSDIACRVGGDEFAVIMPEAGIAHAEQLYQLVESSVSSRPVGPVTRVSVSAGVAELQDGDDGRTLFERGDAAMRRAKGAGKARSFPSIVPEQGTGAA